MTSVNGQYLQGFVVPVGTANKEAYRDMAASAWPMFRDYGALSIMEAWGEDVADGEVTDFRRAVLAEENETVVFSWIVWPDRATCDAASERMRTDDRMKPDGPMPFDGRRMIYAGFAPIFQADR